MRFVFYLVFALLISNAAVHAQGEMLKDGSSGLFSSFGYSFSSKSSGGAAGIGVSLAGRVDLGVSGVWGNIEQQQNIHYSGDQIDIKFTSFAASLNVHVLKNYEPSYVFGIKLFASAQSPNYTARWVGYYYTPQNPYTRMENTVEYRANIITAGFSVYRVHPGKDGKINTQVSLGYVYPFSDEISIDETDRYLLGSLSLSTQVHLAGQLLLVPSVSASIPLAKKASMLTGGFEMGLVYGL